MRTSGLGLGLTSSLVHLLGGVFLVFMLASGVLQDADQWGQYRERVVAQITLLTIGSVAGILASIVALRRPQGRGLGGPSIPAGMFLAAAVVTIVSVPLGWGYWLEFGSNVSFFAVIIPSIAYTMVYFAVGALLFVRR